MNKISYMFVIYFLANLDIFAENRLIDTLNIAASRNQISVVENYLKNKIYHIEAASNIEDWYFSKNYFAYSCDSSNTNKCLYDSKVQKQKYSWSIQTTNYGLSLYIYSINKKQLVFSLPISFFMDNVTNIIGLCGIYSKDVNLGGEKCSKEDRFSTPNIYLDLLKNNILPIIK